MIYAAQEKKRDLECSLYPASAHCLSQLLLSRHKLPLLISLSFAHLAACPLPLLHWVPLSSSEWHCVSTFLLIVERGQHSPPNASTHCYLISFSYRHNTSIPDHPLGATDHAVPISYRPFSPLHFHFIKQDNSSAATRSLFHLNDFWYSHLKNSAVSLIAVTSDPIHAQSSMEIFRCNSGGGAQHELFLLLAESSGKFSVLWTQWWTTSKCVYFPCPFADFGSGAKLQVFRGSRQSGGLLQGTVFGSPSWYRTICLLHQSQHPPRHQVRHRLKPYFPEVN